MRIGELARRTGVSPRTIRFYESVGILSPRARTPSGYRLFDDEAVRRLAFVRRARRLGLSLNEIREILEVYDRGQAPCPRVVALLERKIAVLSRQIAGLQALRRELLTIRRSARLAAEDGPQPRWVCRLIERPAGRAGVR